jgi:hypothetical protein
MQRRAEFRPFSWLNDLWRRDHLDLLPPYQRRGVWPERFRSDFITTVLLNYPCPAIFLYQEIRADGSFLYKVVDGKQRLRAVAAPPLRSYLTKNPKVLRFAHAEQTQEAKRASATEPDCFKDQDRSPFRG